MRLFGLIGNPVSHSWSAKYFAEKFRREKLQGCRYDLFPLDEIAELTELLAVQPDLKGLNVTLPYKKQVIPLLHETDQSATNTGAVNCIRISRRKNHIFLKGYNTDAEAFRQSLRNFVGKYTGNALLLGNGGAANAVKYVLDTEKIPFIRVNRKQVANSLTYEQVTEQHITQYPLIINATSCGMHPDVTNCPSLPYQYFSNNNLLFDLVYNPLETEFLKRGKERGSAICNGLEMLHLQAEMSWEIWNEDEQKFQGM